MAFLAGWFSGGKAFISRVASKVRAGVTRVIHIVTGQPVTRGSVTPKPEGGVTDLPVQQKRDLLETGTAQTPTGEIHIDIDKQDKTIAGKIPGQWMDELNWKEPKITGKASIFGEPFHYQIEFMVSVRQRDENNNVFHSFQKSFYTVTSEEELTKEQAIARGLELAEIDYNTDDPYFGGTVIGIGEVQPVVYTS